MSTPLYDQFEKCAGLPVGVGNVLGRVGDTVTQTVGKGLNWAAGKAPNLINKAAPQLHKGMDWMTANTRAVGGAALGAGAATIGAGLRVMGRSPSQRQ
jgi:hypothetical protein